MLFLPPPANFTTRRLKVFKYLAICFKSHEGEISKVINTIAMLVHVQAELIQQLLYVFPAKVNWSLEAYG